MTSTDDLEDRLRRLAHEAAAARAAVNDVRRAPAAATDATGCVQVTLDGAGLPVAVRVAQTWHWHLAARDLPAAVRGACAAATQAGLAAVLQFPPVIADRVDETVAPAAPVAPAGAADSLTLIR